MQHKQRTFPKLSSFARLLFAEYRKLHLPSAEEPIVVAVSGGADSIALLLALDELKVSGKIKASICVAHLDHGLRPSSKADARHVASLAKQLGHDSVTGRADVGALAREAGDNLEQAARRARYAFLERTARRKGARYILTAHTMDDQAETVLLRLMRGSAAVGLGGMESARPIKKGSKIQLVRPLLSARRADTENYCLQRKANFIVDEMNENQRFSRVKVRKQLLPLMQSFNSKIVEALSRTASLLREDSSQLLSDADELLQTAALASVEKAGRSKTRTPAVDVTVLKAAPPALRRRAIKQWISEERGDARRLEMVHLLAVEKLLFGTTGGRVVELPGGAIVKRIRGRLELEVKKD